MICRLMSLSVWLVVWPTSVLSQSMLSISFSFLFLPHTVQLRDLEDWQFQCVLGCVGVSIIHRTLTHTSGSLTCVCHLFCKRIFSLTCVWDLFCKRIFRLTCVWDLFCKRIFSLTCVWDLFCKRIFSLTCVWDLFASAYARGALIYSFIQGLL